MNNFYVYCHKDSDGKIRYFGKGRNKRAWNFTKRNPYWKNVFKNTPPTVEILVDHLSESAAFELEKFFIAEAKADGIHLCNLTDGGEGMSGYLISDETRKKMSINRRGKKLSKEHKDKLSILKKGKKCSDEEISRLRRIGFISSKVPFNKGKKLMPKHIENLKKAHLGKSPGNKGIPMSQEQKIKCSIAAKFRKYTEIGIPGW